MQTPSLLPYLQGSDSNLYLDLRSLLAEGLFCPDYSSGLLAEGYHVDMRTNAGSLICRADLLIQQDVAPAAGNSAGSWTNIDIETAWQNAYQLHSQRGSGTTVLFSEQVDEDGTFLQFSPLLFCTRRTLFFSPLCKQCLAPLELCRDDTLLQHNGLPLYSKSIARYLYCPSCSPEAGSPWYAKVRESEDLAKVGDEKQLLADMGAVSLAAQAGTDFPCCDCPYQEQCFGEKLGVEHAVAVFSFYPFYAMLLDSTDCDGKDFLTRISGATVEQAATHARERFGKKTRLPSSILSSISPEVGFLRPQETRGHFAEVLYLKLLFLNDVARQLFSGEESVSITGNNLSPADLRVRFDPFSSFQKFWSFSVVFPGLCSPDILKGGPKPPETSCCYMFGMFWFLVLGINSEQDESDIYRKLALLLDRDLASATDLNNLLELLPPSQIMWQPERYQVNGENEARYRVVLELGWDILLSAYTGQQTNGAQICSRIETCLQSLRSLVLSDTGDGERAGFLAEDRVIGNVIERLKKKWQAEADQVETSPGEKVSINNDFGTGQDFFSETIVLKGEDGPVHDSDIHHDETVIIQNDSDGQTTPAIASPDIDKPSAAAKMEETFRLKPHPAPEQVHITEEQTGQPFLEETVVLGGGKVVRQKPGSADPGLPNSGKPADVPEDEEDFMTETVVLKPRKDEG